ncbi:hypothetical protein [Steroidobacter cummioxidans]|uniref:hypothetical protein n=1 Tax=Steroidobacter cummioxidans TaxID=1803913 RepID=UPI001290276C|nr:hypothetical protein [Steroidobacter cummioxidans]
MAAGQLTTGAEDGCPISSRGCPIPSRLKMAVQSHLKMAVQSHLKAMLMAMAIAGVAIVPFAPVSPVSAASSEQSAALTNLLDYLRNQNSTGFLVVQDGKVLIEKNWPAPEGDRQFSMFRLRQRNKNKGALARKTWPRSRRVSSRCWSPLRSTKD